MSKYANVNVSTINLRERRCDPVGIESGPMLHHAWHHSLAQTCILDFISMLRKIPHSPADHRNLYFSHRAEDFATETKRSFTMLAPQFLQAGSWADSVVFWKLSWRLSSTGLGTRGVVG